MGLLRLCIYGLPLVFLAGLFFNPYIPGNERWVLIPIAIFVVWVLALALKADRRLGITPESLKTIRAATLLIAILGGISVVPEVLRGEGHPVPTILSYFELVSCVPAGVLAFVGRAKRKS